MEMYNKRAELVDEPSQGTQQQYYYPEESSDYTGQEMFSQPNDLKVIQEYNYDQNVPTEALKQFWALTSKSIKLGFWGEQDVWDIYLHKNIIKVGHIVSKPKHKYTFEERNMMNQIDFLLFADFKRGVGMEKYRINERTLQATSVTQNIQGTTGAGTPGKKSGFMGKIGQFFQ